MENILTPEEKKYLRFVSKYLLSYGEHTGTIRIEDFDSYDSDSAIKYGIGQFEENYYLEVPEGLEPIIAKIASYAAPRIQEPSEDTISTSLEITIDPDKLELGCYYNYSYYSNEDSSVEYTSDDYKFNDMFEEMSESNIDWVEVPFTGSGDSGSIDTPTDKDGSMVNVPASIEDWCYNQLESHYGGWEINEGSQGKFVFDYQNRTIELIFSWNNEITEQDTILEFAFGN